MRHGRRDPHDDAAPTRQRSLPPPVPTIGELLREDMGGWVWFHCVNSDCLYHAPMRLAPLAERFGPNVSSDLLRDLARCPACGHRGVSLCAPSCSVSREGGPGWAEFPTYYRDGLWGNRPIEARPRWKWKHGPTVKPPAEPRQFEF